MLKISDLTPTATADGHWTNGNVAGGVSPTIMDAGWFNAVQDELVNAIEKSGLALDKNKQDQLYQAIKSIVRGEFDSTVLIKANNLSDVADQSASRNNLSVYSKAEADSTFVHKSGDKIQWMDVTDGLAVGKSIVANGDLTINGQDFITKRGNYTSQDGTTRQTNGLRINGSGDMFVDIFHLERIGQYHSLGFHVVNGGGDGWFEFRNDGSFHSGSTVGAGNARLYTDANLSGDKWGGYLSDWLSREFNSRDSNINTRATVDYVNNEINGVNSKVDGRATNDYVNGTFVRDIRFGGLESAQVWNALGYGDQPPYVITGVYNGNSDGAIDIVYRRPVQKNINNVWYNVGSL